MEIGLNLREQGRNGASEHIHGKMNEGYGEELGPLKCLSRRKRKVVHRIHLYTLAYSLHTLATFSFGVGPAVIDAGIIKMRQQAFKTYLRCERQLYPL